MVVKRQAIHIVAQQKAVKLGRLERNVERVREIPNPNWTTQSHCTRHTELEGDAPETLSISEAGVPTTLPPVVASSVGGGTQVREAEYRWSNNCRAVGRSELV